MNKLLIVLGLALLCVTIANAEIINPYTCINYTVDTNDINIMFSNWLCDSDTIELMEFNDANYADTYLFIVRVYGMGSKMIAEDNMTLDGYDVTYLETLTTFNESEFYYTWNCNNASYSIYSNSKPDLDSITKAIISNFCSNEKFSTPHINYKSLLEETLKKNCIYQIGRTDLNSTDVLIREGNPDTIYYIMSGFIDQNELVDKGKQTVESIEYEVYEHPVFGDLYYVIIGDKCALMIQGTNEYTKNLAVLNQITPNMEQWTSNDDSLIVFGIILLIILVVLIFLAKRPPGYTISKKELEKNKLNPWKLDKLWKRFIYFLGVTGVFSIWGLLFVAFWLGEKRKHVFDKVKRMSPGTEIVTTSQKLLVILGWVRVITLSLVLIVLVIAKFAG